MLPHGYYRYGLWVIRCFLLLLPLRSLSSHIYFNLFHSNWAKKYVTSSSQYSDSTNSKLVSREEKLEKKSRGLFVWKKFHFFSKLFQRGDHCLICNRILLQKLTLKSHLVRILRKSVTPHGLFKLEWRYFGGQ